MPRSTLGTIAAIWGVTGVLVLLGNAVVRLTLVALEPIGTGMAAWQWALYGASILFNGYSEGYRAMQQQFAPRVVARAAHLARDPRPLHVALAPLFCMGLFHSTRRRMITSWLLVVGIVAIVVLVRQLDQPYRGIIDAGVVVGLAWGILVILVLAARAASGAPPRASPELPDGRQ
jgi:hypothetical protein